MLPVWAATQRSEMPPQLMLAKRFQGEETLSLFGVSEKYDGIRAFWDGISLVTRSGRIINAPDWFLAQLPDEPLDGELWLGYGRFSEVSGLIRRNDSDSSELWQDVQYRVFDLPEVAGTFDERYQALLELIGDPSDIAANDNLQPVEQLRISSEKELDDLLQEVLQRGGEGLMLHRWDSFYFAGRSSDLLKVTPLEDAEAIVTGYEPGQGRLKGMMGALRVRLQNGREMLLGSGFSDAERQAPPALGARVRFTFRGLTADGLPRFASFDRVRPPE
ncbi:MAG: DNA ligase [Thalassolituus maritimus]|nr:MAG: DNA ligase [Thalassolituus maritimus]